MDNQKLTFINGMPPESLKEQLDKCGYVIVETNYFDISSKSLSQQLTKFIEISNIGSIVKCFDGDIVENSLRIINEATAAKNIRNKNFSTVMGGVLTRFRAGKVVMLWLCREITSNALMSMSGFDSRQESFCG